MEESIRLVVGVDVGDVSSHLYATDTDSGEVLFDGLVPTDADSFREVFSQWQRARVALEVGTHSPWLNDLLQGLGHEVLVANARKLRFIYAGTNKQDRLDAQKLAWVAHMEPRLLYPIRHRSRGTREDLALIRARQHLVSARVRLVVAVRGVVKAFGLRVPSCSTERFAEVALRLLPEGLRPALEPLLATVAELTTKIDAYDRQIVAMSKEKYPETSALRQVAGVGWLTALCFILTLEDPTRFRKSRDVGPALGLVPRRDQSGRTDRQLSITKTGDAYLRSLLVESAQGALRSSARDSDLKRWGRRRARRGGKTGKKQAVIGVARRLGVLLHSLWVTQATYEPLRNSNKAV